MIADPPKRNISIDKLEIWEEANVRKVGASTDIEELANNIKQNGVKNPLLVKRSGSTYKIFAGQRRFLAATHVGLGHLPCYVYDTISLKDAILLSLSENVFSRQMTALDKANAVKELLGIHRDKKKVCRILGIKPRTLQRYLQYHGLPHSVKDLVDSGDVPMKLAINVMGKFSKSNATDILHQLASTRKLSVNRKQLVSAIAKADGGDTIDDIRREARNQEMSVAISLEPAQSRALQRLANGKKQSVDEAVTAILKRYLNRQ